MRYNVIHIGTGVIVGRYSCREEAERWLNSYGASNDYKQQNYRIVPADSRKIVSIGNGLFAQTRRA